MVVRDFIRSILSIKNGESIEDGIRRHELTLQKKWPHTKYSEEEFKNHLLSLGIKSGDVVIVHSSWRGMFALNSSPEMIIDILISIIGNTGTLLMPCYGAKNVTFDVNHTRSTAGVLSETLRNRDGAVRSIFPKFSMIAYGGNAEEIVSSHINSRYQFDELSPYYISMIKYNAKVLLLGMGKSSHKISVFHCASYDCKNTIDFYKDCFKKECKGKVIVNDETITIDYLDRADNYSNNKRVFTRLFKAVPKQVIDHIGYSIVEFNAADAYRIAYEFCLNGGELYTH